MLQKDTWSFSLWLQQKVTVLGAHLKGLFTRWLVNQVFVSPKYADSFISFSVRDLSLILDALLKTKSRSVLLDIINKNGIFPCLQLALWKLSSHQLRIFCFVLWKDSKCFIIYWSRIESTSTGYLLYGSFSRSALLLIQFPCSYHQLWHPHVAWFPVDILFFHYSLRSQIIVVFDSDMTCLQRHYIHYELLSIK